MSQAMYDYIRGLSDEIPHGYTAQGLAVYRYLVRLGVTQLIESSYPELREQLDDTDWDWLINQFVQQSAWTSHFYGDLDEEFREFIRNQAKQLEQSVPTR
jgi:hypothetical protein